VFVVGDVERGEEVSGGREGGVGGGGGGGGILAG